MSAGASGGADIEGRAFDAGPTAQNESAASIGEAAGLSGQAARDYGIAQMDALDAQHGTNFGQRARGLTGNNSIGTAELESFGFDADAPAGLQHAQQRTAFEQGLFDPATMMAQNTGSNFPTPIDDALKNTVFGAVTNATWDVYDEQDKKIESMLQQGLISVDEANQMKGHHLSQQGFLSPLVNALQSPWQMYDQVMDDQNNRPNVSLAQSIIDGFKAGYNNLLGMDYGPQVENKEALDAYLDMIGQPRTSSGVLSQGGIPTSSMQVGPDTTFYDGHIGPNNVHHGMRVGPFGYGYESLFDGVDVQALDNAILGLDNAFASTDNNFGNYSGISPSFDTGSLSRAGGDPRLAEAQRLAAQLLAQQAAASVIGDIDFTPEEVKIINTPPADTTPGTTPPGTTIPPGNTTPPVTTPPDDSVADDPPGRGNRPNPIVKKRKAIRKKIATATKAKLNPKGLKKLPKFAQEALKRGVRPDTGSDHVQDQISQFLNPPKPIDYSNIENRGR